MYPRMFTGKFTTLKIHVTNALLYLKVPAVPLVCTYHLLIYVCTFVCLFTLQLPVYRISISIITESSNLISFKRFPRRSFKCASTLVQFLQFFIASVQAFVLSSAHQSIVAGRGRRGFSTFYPTFYLCFMFLHTNQFHDPQYLRHCRRH